MPIVAPIAPGISAVLFPSTQDWQTVLRAVAVLEIVQQIESNLIAPLGAGRTVSVVDLAVKLR